MEICWTELKVKEVLKLEDTMMPYQLLHMQTAKLDTTLIDKTLQIVCLRTVHAKSPQTRS